MRLALARASDPVPQVRFALMVSGGFFQTLGVQPALGRAFTDEESHDAGRDAVVVLSDELWRSQFGGRSRRRWIDGPAQRTALHHRRRRAAAVHRSQPVPASVAVHAPMTALTGRRGRTDRCRIARRPYLRCAAALRAASGSTARRPSSALARALTGTYPDTNRARTFTVRTEFGARVAEAPATLAIVTLLLALAGLVLFIACANVAGLLLARARSRGARDCDSPRHRRRTHPPAATAPHREPVLSAAGALAGMGLAWLVIRALASWRLPTDTPLGLAVQLDLRVLAFTAAASMASACLFGLVPAWRTTSPALTDALKSPTPARRSARQRGRHALVVAQIALCASSSWCRRPVRRISADGPSTPASTRCIMMIELDPELVGYARTHSPPLPRARRSRARAPGSSRRDSGLGDSVSAELPRRGDRPRWVPLSRATNAARACR